MFYVKKTDVFIKWLGNLKDITGKARILSRLKRISLGNLGVTKSVGEGVFEIKVDYGAGYRIYYIIEDKVVILLLCGGDKRTQEKDIKEAKEIKRWIKGKK